MKSFQQNWKVFEKTQIVCDLHNFHRHLFAKLASKMSDSIKLLKKKRSKKFFLLQTQNPFIPWLPNLDIKRHLLASQPGYNLLLSLSLLFSPLLSFFSSLLSSTLVSNNNNRKKGYALHPLDIRNDAIMFTCFTLQSLSRSASTCLHYRLWSLSLIISFYFRFLFVCNLPSLLPLYCCSKYFILTRFDD